VIALVCTLLIAVYVLGPDLIARWILGFVVPRKTLTQSKGEEITRGLLWSLIPLSLAWLSRHTGPVSVSPSSKFDVETFFSGLYSDSLFREHTKDFFSSASGFIRFNACILLRMYSLVVIAAITFNLLIKRYGRLRYWMSTRPWASKLRPVLATIILPHISEWHIILSPILLPSQEMNIEVDVLTKTGTLYQGALSNKMLGTDGSLQNLTLSNPRRFRRDQFLEARKSSPDARPEDYWKVIPGNLFVIMAADITTLNVRHSPSSVRRYGQEFNEIAEAIRVIQGKVQAIQAERASGPTNPTVDDGI
jgi:hypothetical protein